MYKKGERTFHLVLRDVVKEYGLQVLTQPRLIGIVADLMHGDFGFKPVVRRSVEMGIGERIISIKSNEQGSMALDSLKQSFQEMNFLRKEAAAYLVDSYAYAMGLISELDVPEEQLHEIPTGEPIFVPTDDGEFCGYRNGNGDRCGLGILKTVEGKYYAGEWKLNMQMGLGMEFTNTRRRYVGEWRMNKPHGIGTEIQEDGCIYSGQWANGLRHGRGTLYFPNGESVTTLFSNGKMTDTIGIWFLKDQSFVQGRMTPNGPTGLCFHTMPDGTLMEEYWCDGRVRNF